MHVLLKQKDTKEQIVLYKYISTYIYTVYMYSLDIYTFLICSAFCLLVFFNPTLIGLNSIITNNK